MTIHVKRLKKLLIGAAGVFVSSTILINAANTNNAGVNFSSAVVISNEKSGFNQKSVFDGSDIPSLKPRFSIPAPESNSMVPLGKRLAARTGIERQYGDDDRIEVARVSQPVIRQTTESVGMLIKKDKVEPKPNGNSLITGEYFSYSDNLCRSEPFRNQVKAGFCTGFLVKPDVVATAFHCVDASKFPIADTKFVFGYKANAAGTIQKVISNAEIYSIKQIVAHDPVQDWALIQLDRRADNHPVLKIRKTGKIVDGQKVHIIGHPLGLPMKVGTNAFVRDNTNPSYFLANLDAYGGNSGSPVFNSSDNSTVEGILFKGGVDFENSGTCQISSVCPDTGLGPRRDCFGEYVVRSTLFASYL